MNRKLITSAVAVSFAAAMLSIGGIIGGAEINLGESTTYVLTDYAPHVALFALAAGAFLGAREIETYETWELVAVAGAVAVPALVYADVVQVVDLLDTHHPYSGLVAAALGFLGYHAVTFKTTTKKSSLSEEI